MFGFDFEDFFNINSSLCEFIFFLMIFFFMWLCIFYVLYCVVVNLFVFNLFDICFVIEEWMEEI